MASYTSAVSHILLHEGGYANVEGDKGGETYAGIARNFYPDLPLWDFIDAIKRTKGPIKRNTVFAELNDDVDKFYYELWTKHKLSEVRSQKVATLMFDYIVHSGRTGIKNMQNILGVTADGVIGPVTLAAVNKSDPSILYDKILNQRKNFLIALAEKPDQNKFLAGWMKRINDLAQLNSAAGKITGVAVGIGIVLLLTSILQK